MSPLRRSPDLGPAGQPLHLLLGEYPVPPDLGSDAVLLGEMPDLAGSDGETLGDLGGGEHYCAGSFWLAGSMSLMFHSDRLRLINAVYFA